MRAQLGALATTCRPDNVIGLMELSDVQLLCFLRTYRFRVKLAVKAVVAENSFR